MLLRTFCICPSSPNVVDCAAQYGYGHWQAIKNAVRRNPAFRFDYFLRSIPVELLGKRCEQLMRAAEKEVEQIERQIQEAAELLPVQADEGKQLPPVRIPKIRDLQRQMRESRRVKAEIERKELADKVEEFELEMKKIQDRLRSLNESAATSPAVTEEETSPSEKETRKKPKMASTTPEPVKEASPTDSRDNGAVGPDGNFIEFPEYNGSDRPVEWKKPFTHFCNRTRKDVKASLDPAERRNKVRHLVEYVHYRPQVTNAQLTMANKEMVNGLLKDRWLDLPEDEKSEFRDWCEWDKKRYEHDLAIFEKSRPAKKKDVTPIATSYEEDAVQDVHVPKKKRKMTTDDSIIPKKKRAST
jgi:SLIDE